MSGADKPKPAIEVRAVSRLVGGRAVLRDIAFEAGPGEFVALLGANGAGKSTLLDLLAGVATPDTGTVHLGGREQAQWTTVERARLVSHLPQSVDAELPFSVRQIVAMGRYPHTDGWFESPDDEAAVEQAMRRANVEPFRERALRTLSGGERQRVLLAACLAQGAGVLLLDEPNTFLDLDAQLDCFTRLAEMVRDGGLCVAVTHDLNLALGFCTRLVVLREGAVAADLPVARAGVDRAWLRAISPRLRLEQAESGRLFVAYA